MRHFYVVNHWDLSNYVSMYQYVMWAVTVHHYESERCYFGSQRHSKLLAQGKNNNPLNSLCVAKMAQSLKLCLISKT